MVYIHMPAMGVCIFIFVILIMFERFHNFHEPAKSCSVLEVSCAFVCMCHGVCIFGVCVKLCSIKIHAQIEMCICMYICIYSYMYMYMYMCTFTRIHVHTHICVHRRWWPAAHHRPQCFQIPKRHQYWDPKLFGTLCGRLCLLNRNPMAV